MLTMQRQSSMIAILITLSCTSIRSGNRVVNTNSPKPVLESSQNPQLKATLQKFGESLTLNLYECPKGAQRPEYDYDDSIYSGMTLEILTPWKAPGFDEILLVMVIPEPKAPQTDGSGPVCTRKAWAKEYRIAWVGRKAPHSGMWQLFDENTQTLTVADASDGYEANYAFAGFERLNGAESVVMLKAHMASGSHAYPPTYHMYGYRNGALQYLAEINPPCTELKKNDRGEITGIYTASFSDECSDAYSQHEPSDPDEVEQEPEVSSPQLPECSYISKYSIEAGKFLPDEIWKKPGNSRPCRPRQE